VTNALAERCVDDELEVVQRLCMDNRWAEAEAAIRSLTSVPSASAAAHHLLGRILVHLGRANETEAHMRRALQIAPNYQEVHDDLIIFLDDQIEATHETRTVIRRQWWETFGAHHFHQQTYPNGRDPERPLRVGYVSGDFRFHSAMVAIRHVLFKTTDHHTSYFYSSHPPAVDDAFTQSYRQEHVDRWREAWGLTDDELDAQIRKDEIDILVDLSSYTPFNRLQAFARKPAPITVSAWGYPLGLGWPRGVMDYLFADRVTIRPEEHGLYSERIAELPCFLPFTTILNEADVPPLPATPVFAIFQRPGKIHHGALLAWNHIMQAVPEAMLVFKGERYTEDMRRWITGYFDPDAVRRIAFSPVTSCAAHIRAYGGVSLSLDTWPQTGGVSTGESLWMGVPVLTLYGERITQRVSASILSSVGLPQFITLSVGEYVHEAVTWATARYGELGKIREGLRSRLLASPVCAGYEVAVASTYRQMWRQYCQEQEQS